MSTRIRILPAALSCCLLLMPSPAAAGDGMSSRQHDSAAGRILMRVDMSVHLLVCAEGSPPSWLKRTKHGTCQTRRQCNILVL